MTSFADFLQYFANGLAFGSVIVLAAIGLTLVYGILNLSNFAQGDLVTLGAYGAFFFTVATPLETTTTWAFVVAGLLAAAAAASRVVRLRGRALLERSEARGFGVAAVVIAGLALGVEFPASDVVTTSGLAVALLLALGAYLARRRALAAWGLASGAALAAAWSLASPYFLATALAAAVAAVVAVAFDLVVWRRLRAKRATVLTLLIVSIGVAFVLRNSIALRFGPEYLNFERPLELPLAVGPVLVTADQMTTMVIAAALVAGVHAFLRYTRTGKALRALSDDADLARLSGIDVDRTVLALWALAAALAAVAGALLPLNNFLVGPSSGFLLILIIFAAVILGGIGSAYGAMLGGLVIGIAMEVTAGLWRPEYKFAAAFVILVLVLLVRPQGILGGRLA